MSVRAATRNRQHETPKESFLGRLLDPIDLLSEAIFSVLIVLMFTLAFRIMTLGANPTQPVTSSYINDLLIAAASATIAWGTIDGIMYALMSMFARGETHRLQQQIQLAETEEEAIQIVADELDYVLEPISGEVQRRRLYQDVLEHLHDGTPPTIRLSREDIAGGLGSVLVAVLAVLPSLAPLLLFYNEPAVRHPDVQFRLICCVVRSGLPVGKVHWRQFVGGWPGAGGRRGVHGVDRVFTRRQVDGISPIRDEKCVRPFCDG